MEKTKLVLKKEVVYMCPNSGCWTELSIKGQNTYICPKCRHTFDKDECNKLIFETTNND